MKNQTNSSPSLKWKTTIEVYGCKGCDCLFDGFEYYCNETKREQAFKETGIDCFDEKVIYKRIVEADDPPEDQHPPKRIREVKRKLKRKSNRVKTEIAMEPMSYEISDVSFYGYKIHVLTSPVLAVSLNDLCEHLSINRFYANDEVRSSLNLASEMIDVPQYEKGIEIFLTLEGVEIWMSMLNSPEDSTLPVFNEFRSRLPRFVQDNFDNQKRI